jgi:hypothetical protein
LITANHRRSWIRLRLGILLALAVFSLTLGKAVAQQDTPATDVQAIVDKFFPETLPQIPAQEGEPAVPRSSSFVVYDSFSDGTPQTIIAAYTNGAGAAIRGIRAGAARAYSVVYEPANFQFDGGPDCSVELVDVDFDGVKELFVSFQRFEGPPQDWVFRWDGSQFRSLGPTEKDRNGVESSLLTLATLVDLDHASPLSLTAYTAPADPDFLLYRFSGGMFVPDRPVPFIVTFEKCGGREPESWQSVFNHTGPAAPHTLRIINGERDGSLRVDGARVVLNGAEIVSPGNFNSYVEFLTIAVSLQAENTIEITVTGSAPGKVLVAIEGQAAAQPARRSAMHP